VGMVAERVELRSHGAQPVFRSSDGTPSRDRCAGEILHLDGGLRFDRPGNFSRASRNDSEARWNTDRRRATLLEYIARQSHTATGRTAPLKRIAVLVFLRRIMRPHP